MYIQRLDPRTVTVNIAKLVSLLQDAVQSGGSIGFLPPLSDSEANEYWQDVSSALKAPYRILLVATEGDEVIGTVQLDMASRANGSHRAEVCKLMVHTKHRSKGVARALMGAIEDEARKAKRTTLILDTRQGDPSEKLYTKLGYTLAGSIPQYARSVDGSLHTTVFMYKLLNGEK
jgi:ribosomal protein S18 acetylase RimI-like enzyme